MNDTLETLARLFTVHGALAYGESVNQVEHALQCATLAESQSGRPELICAALLHDIGHMLHRDAAAALRQGDDDHHETIGAKFIAGRFRTGVAEPVGLHVQAKRYLCTQDPTYFDTLSPVSRRTLELQGGPLTQAEVLGFNQRPYYQEALMLRRWDEGAKVAGAATPSLDYFLGIAQTCLV